VFDVDPATPTKKGTPTSTQFLAHVCCGQMAGWMKTPLGTEVDLGPGHIVLDGVPAPVKGEQQPLLFGPSLLWPRLPISATADLLSTQLKRELRTRVSDTSKSASLWSPYVIGQTIIFLPCGYYLSFFPRLISAAGDWMSTILPHMVWP